MAGVKAHGRTPGKVVGTAVPALVMTIAVFMIPSRAQSVITITFAALTGSVAPGAALAFGLGGRDVASRMLVEA